MVEEKKKKCFIITPIGDDGTEIRRHIDGIIDAVLIPVLEEHFGYDLEVAHRIDAPGNIPKQVITSIFDSDLVVANLTGNNPNVMYELALRHCFGTAAIMIAELGTKIPADIIGERTIFYVNDVQGVIDLKNNLKNKVEAIQKNGEIKQYGPVYDALRDALDRDAVIDKISGSVNANAFEMILDKLDILQSDIRKENYSYNRHSFTFLEHNKQGSAPLEYLLQIGSDDIQSIMTEDVLPLLDKMNITYKWSIMSKTIVKLLIWWFNLNQLIEFDEGLRKIFRHRGISEKSIMGGIHEKECT